MSNTTPLGAGEILERAADFLEFEARPGGKAHYYSEHAPTIPCPECYGAGRIPELTANDMKELLRAAFPAAFE
jgi:hypothetical protein